MHSSVVSSSVKASSVNALDPVVPAEPLTERIRNSLAALLRVPASRITVPANAEKYYDEAALGDDGAPTMAAVTAQVIPGDGTRVNEVFVTNSCLKFAAEEYRKLREASGRMKVVAERATGDGSVVFQLSQRL
ncbi:hypothetical protein AB0P36_20380 [Streptomyces flavidovirens]|uniref:hypothetical protein n=1 Tax=Streptomyces flavidovirens TaxID=67298 RepID=UPI00342003A1